MPAPRQRRHTRGSGTRSVSGVGTGVGLSRLSPAERQAGCLPHLSGGTPGVRGHGASVGSALMWGRAGCRQPNGRQDACPTSAAAHPGFADTEHQWGRHWCGAEPAVAGRAAGRMPAPHRRRHIRGSRTRSISGVGAGGGKPAVASRAAGRMPAPYRRRHTRGSRTRSISGSAPVWGKPAVARHAGRQDVSSFPHQWGRHWCEAGIVPASSFPHQWGRHWCGAGILPAVPTRDSGRFVGTGEIAGECR